MTNDKHTTHKGFFEAVENMLDLANLDIETHSSVFNYFRDNFEESEPEPSWHPYPDGLAQMIRVDVDDVEIYGIGVPYRGERREHDYWQFIPLYPNQRELPVGQDLRGLSEAADTDVAERFGPLSDFVTAGCYSEDVSADAFKILIERY